MNANPRRPQLTGEELQQLKWLLGGVLTLLALWTVFYMDIEAWAVMTLTSVAAIATLAWPTLPARVPRITHTLAFPLIVAFFVLDLWLRAEVLPSMVRLDMLLLLYRTISYRARRDDLQVIVLGLFLIVVAGVLTVSLVFAAQLLAYAACALAFLFAITLADTGEKPAVAKPAGPGEVPAWAAHVHWLSLLRRVRAVADWRVVTLGGALFTGVVVVTALLFLAIPRFQLENSMFLDRFISKQARSGFGDTIRFGEVTEIQQDTSIALSVDVSDQRLVPAIPYWRMLILDDYREGTFRLAPQTRNEGFGGFPLTRQRIQGEVIPRTEPGAEWTFYLESGISRYLPLINRFEQLQFTEAQTFQRASVLNLVALRNDPVTMTAYRVTGFLPGPALPDPEFARRWARRTARTPWRVLYLNSASNEAFRPRVTRVLNEILTGAATIAPPEPVGPEGRNENSPLPGAEQPAMPVAEFTEKICAWLHAQHGYTLSPQIPTGDGDPLVRWLSSREPGHCELFAGSFVVLARAAGFPARIVTGFKGGTWNAYSTNLTVRNSDAHAWAEIFDPASGAWLRADPLEVTTAAQSTEGAAAAALARRLDRSWSARLESLRVFWYRRIVSFDQQSQLETLRAIKESTQASGRRARAALARLSAVAKAWLTAPWDTRRVGQLGGVLLVVAGLAWLWREFGRGWWRQLSHPHTGQRTDPIRREAGHWLARLADARRTGARAKDLEAVWRDLERVRFGARETWPAPEPVFRRSRQVLRNARRRVRDRR